MKTKKRDIASMFESMKDTLEERKTSGSEIKKNFLKCVEGNTYLVRLILYTGETKADNILAYEYFSHSWISNSTGKQVFFLSPKTWGERCPISEERMKIYNDGSEEENFKAKKLDRSQNWLVNCYVIKDPTTPENEGTVKILKMSKELHKIFNNAVRGEDNKEFGYRVFDLSEDGCNLRIKCEKRGEDDNKKGGGNNYSKRKSPPPTYVSSKFLAPSEIAGMTDEKMDEIYDSAFNLKTLFTVTPEKELQKAVAVHFYGESAESSESDEPAAPKKKVPSKVVEDEEDDIPMPPKKKVVIPNDEDDEPVVPKKKVSKVVVEDEDDEPVVPTPAKKKVVVEDDEDDIPMPPKKSSKPSKVVEDEDDENEEEDDEPIIPKSLPKKNNSRLAALVEGLED